MRAERRRGPGGRVKVSDKLHVEGGREGEREDRRMEGWRGSEEAARRQRVRGGKTTQDRRTRRFGCSKGSRRETLECQTQVTAEERKSNGQRGVMERVKKERERERDFQ